MKIHFVCTGNVFRSRLAESYANYLISKNHLKNITVSSSGIRADRDENGPIAWVTLDVLKKNGLEKYASPTWVQTSAKILSEQDKVIFMEPIHLRYSQDNFNYHQTNFEIWHIPDMSPSGNRQQTLEFGRRTLITLKTLVEKLLQL